MQSRLARTLIAVGATAALAVPASAMARHGADDPAGHDTTTTEIHKGADDTTTTIETETHHSVAQKHARKHARKHHRHHHARHGEQHASHGADDGPAHT